VQPETVIVTGASGFLGRYVVLRLCDAGYKVIGVSRDRAGIGDTGGSFKQIQLNLEDPACLDELTSLARHGVNAIIHFAAVLPTSFGIPGTEDCGRRNRCIDTNIMGVCERVACSLVYGSTASIYSRQSADLKEEDSGHQASESYAAEKQAIEQEALHRFLATASVFTGLRITAPYGPYQQANTVVKIFLQRALQNKTLFYDGTGTREQDFIHAADVAEAVLCSIKYRVPGVFNIGCGAPVTMKKLAEITVRSIPGCKSEVRPSGAPDPQESYYARISIAKARSRLGWKPRITLDHGISQWAKFLDSEKQHANCFLI
jgi:UDP-glucose 4-epimerase